MAALAKPLLRWRLFAVKDALDVFEGEVGLVFRYPDSHEASRPVERNLPLHFAQAFDVPHRAELASGSVEARS